MKSKKPKEGKSGSGNERSNENVFILIDNVTPGVAKALAGETVSFFTYKSLGLPEGADDETLLKTFNKVSTEANKMGVVLTSDRGKTDGQMPLIAQKYSKLAVVTNSVKGADQQIAAHKRLRNFRKFKNLATYVQKYKKVHISKEGSIYKVVYTTAKNKTRQKKL